MKNKSLWPLFKILASNNFSLGTFFEGFKKGIKGILKNLLVIILILYFVVVAGGMYITLMNLLGNGLLNTGDIEKMPIIVIFSAFCIVLFFGFVSAATNYYTGCGEEQFLAMPLKPVEIFSAKVGVTAITDASLGAVVVIVGSIIYGIKAGLVTKPLFYVGMLLTTCAIVCISLFLIYGLMLVFLLICPKLRKRNILTGIATVLIFVFVCCYSFLSSQMSMMLDMDAGAAAPLVQMIRIWAGKAPFLMIFADAMSGKILPMLLMVAITLVFIFGIVPVFAPGYIKTLNGFSDIKSKKISKAKAQDVINRNVKSNSVFSTLFTRDLRTMFREPSFFANGPLLLIILPVIMLLSGGISFLMASKDNLSAILNELQIIFLQMSPEGMLRFKHYATLIIAAIAVFMGNCTNVASTSFSREGKALYDLKAMPIEPDTIVLVKFWHAFMYCLIAVVVISLYFIGAVALLNIPLTVSEIFTMLIEACIISLLVSLVLIFTEMFIDTVNPKLQWENPTAAFKQNVNAVVSSFISMGVVGIFVVLMIFLPKTSLGMLLIALIFAVIAAPLGFLYFRYAVKRIPKM